MPALAQDYPAIVASPDRSDADRQTDKRRDPVELLTFTGARTGWTVLDMGAGAGYSTELMARCVGPSGKVFGQNDADNEKLRARMTTPAMSNVAVLVRPSDNPLPVDQRGVDLITYFFAYHDTTYMEIDRAKMNRALFAALKPGGFLVVADHSARPEDGATVGDGSYQESFSYVDGLGRTILSLTQADPSALDGAGWIASGLNQYDAKGETVRAYLPWFQNGNPPEAPLGRLRRRRG